MKKAIVTRAFQFRGAMPRPGAVLSLSDAEAKDRFVAAHVRILDEGETPPQKPAYFGNGVKAAKNNPTGADAAKS